MFGTQETTTTEHTMTTQIETFLDGVRAISAEYHAKHHPTLKQPTFSAMKGPRYTRVVREDSGRSVYCFVDNTNGDVLKAAGWKAPAKHARGNLNDTHGGLKFLGPYGPAYLR